MRSLITSAAFSACPFSAPSVSLLGTALWRKRLGAMMVATAHRFILFLFSLQTTLLRNSRRTWRTHGWRHAYGYVGSFFHRVVKLRNKHGFGFGQWREKRAGPVSTGFVQGRWGSLWSYCSPQCTGAKMFTYWLVPCYRDGGNGRAIGFASNRATHLNTRGQRGSGTNSPSLIFQTVKPDANDCLIKLNQV